MEYMDFNERNIVFVDENGRTIRNFDGEAKFISSIDISGRVSVTGRYVKRSFRNDVVKAVRTAVAVNGPSAVGIQIDVEQYFSDKGYEAECEIISMNRVIYQLGEKVSEFELLKKRNSDDSEKTDE